MKYMNLRKQVHSPLFSAFLRSFSVFSVLNLLTSVN